jgi:tripartite-type tricarboxylate transporter receptor subunit TctC
MYKVAFIGSTLACLLSVAPAMADAVADFYRGKTITITAATGAGSAYGLHGRLLAEHMQKHIPGNPSVIMQFMPGAGGATMANHTYNVAPKDGTHLGFPLKYISVNQALGLKGLRYDAREFGYVGSLGPINSAVIFWRATSPAGTLEEAKRKEVVMGSTGRSSETFITPTLMNNLLGTTFKIVTGYDGMAGISLAMERGEVHGRAGSWDSLKSSNASWLKEDRIAIVALSGLERNWDLPDVPTLIELADNDADKEVLRFFGEGNAMGWLIITPPGVPQDRVSALRLAFDKTMQDPAYREAAKGHQLDIVPMKGAELEGLARKTAGASADFIARVKKAMGME